MQTGRSLIVLVLAMILAGVPAENAAHSPELHGFKLVTFEPPTAAPNFQLVDLTGEARQLSDYRGQYVVLNFWATWCPPCLAEMPAMEKLYQHYRERGLVVVAVSSDVEGGSVVQPFIDKLRLTFPVLLDPEGRVSASYGARNLPMTFLLDRDGRVIAAAEGAREWYSEEALSSLEEIILVK